MSTQFDTYFAANQTNLAANAGADLVHKRQRGITLIMVLIFIVTLSLVAAAGLRSVITDAHVVANGRDKALAFQAAESAGREAVAAITLGTHTTTYVTPLPLGGNAEFWRTTSNLTKSSNCLAFSDVTKRFDWDTCGHQSDSTYANMEKPRYVIEAMPATVNSSGTTDCWYRITSRATGGSKEADVILQLMFAKTITGAPTACT